MEPTEYRHPQNDKIKMWDLPGIGTVKFTARDYIKKMAFEKFDFFIIVSNDRFRENDANLAKEIQKMKKKFYFIRSKIDHNIRDEKDSDPDFNEENLLNQIKDNCSKGLQDQGIKSPKVFLVSSLSLDQYEFGAMWKTLEEELPEHQRDALLLALPNISLEVIEQKKKVLGNKIKWYTLASFFGAAVPVPGLSEAVDIGLTMQFANECLQSLGLRPESLQKLSDVTSVPYRDLWKELKIL
uniref:IRG-type G domain-containing protein n=1 Tax=Neogobius melanostomus TaxID=47308 RepID=A0A8C6WS26_9GOBI